MSCWKATCLLGCVGASTWLDAAPLQLGTEAEVDAGRCARLEETLAEGESVWVEVEALGADLRLALRAPDGLPLWQSDDRPANDGVEEAFAVTQSAGVHALEVCAKGPGRLRVARFDRHPATPADRLRVEAERALRRARAARVGKGDLAVALHDARQARAAFQALGLPSREGLALLEGALVAARQKRSEEAEALLREALDLGRRSDDPGLQARALNSLGLRAHERGDEESAVANARDAVAAARRAGDRLQLSQASYNLGIYLAAVGDSAEAIEAYTPALQGFRELGKPEQELQVLNNLGVVYKLRRRYSAALEVQEQVIERAQELDQVATLGSARINQGGLLMLMGEPERARQSYLAALEALPAERAEQRAQAVWNLGHLARALGDESEARVQVGRALAMSRAGGFADLLARSIGFLGTLDLEAGRTEQGRQALEEAVERARAGGFQGLLQEVLNELGEARRQTGDAPGAWQAAEEALALAARTGDEEVRGRTRLLRARLLRDAGQPAAALTEARLALETLERLRGEVPTRELRSTYLAGQRGAFDLAVELELELERREPGQGHGERAFDLAEQARARGLLEALSPVAWSADAESAALRERAGDVAAAREGLARLATGPDTAGSRGRAQRRLDEALAGYQLERESFSRTNPRAASRLERRPARVRDVQAALAADEALLVYHLGESQAFLFVVERERFEALRLGPSAAFAPVIEALLARLRSPAVLGAAQLQSAARGLHALAFAPARLDASRLRRVLVSADGPLRRVPFEALVVSDRGRTAAQLDYLVRHFELAYVPSASVWLELRARADAAAPAAGALAVADPLAGPDLAPLPGARDEARDVVRLASPGAALVGSQASESRVRGLAGQARVLHFATHALVDDRRPALSSLLLTPGDGHDGRLEAWEIASLDLHAELAVLSACASALGRPVAGEGLVGLVQAFLDAGARDVVATLWPIADRGSAEFMRAFYAELRRASPVRALARARRQMLARGGPGAHPYYWAAFVLIGAPEPLASGTPSRPTGS